MSEIIPCATEQDLETAVARAADVVADGECIVLPTDTVYGIGCDAFSAPGVQTLLGAKGRTREMPPPVLIARPEVMSGLADEVSDDARALAEAFWPGALTIVCWAQPSLGWDLGETHGTVALRVPDDRVARAVLERVGPMAVSSANRTGLPAAATAHQAREMLQDRVALYLDDGPRPPADAPAGVRDAASTIVDCTGETPVVLRHGAIPLQRLREVVPSVHGGAQDDDAAGGPAPEGAAVAPSEAGAGGTEPHAGTVVPSAATAGAAATRPAAGPTESAEPARPTGSTEALSGVTSSAAGESAASTTGEQPSDEDLVAALVGESTPTPGAPVDQGRDRAQHTEPRWDGTSALGVAEARRLVAGDDLGTTA
ncbi:L-threonylcarbamoyladenylate synthase [Kocuria sp.]|uniref:L-threonylcarbamoyladenylate synthase n=1 Tax=Kocuria sp. TaxID=1871328 RepID=UPI0026DB718E|nr:L-threonylcarbamoyladenylate synthase [Kocuria sp.]MDO4918587.1 L-threonylcarbamoyladenylate synthase [Kocuria sp.]